MPLQKRLIVIDHDQKVLTSISELLALYEFQVFAASSQAEALRIWEEVRGLVDYVLVDLFLPGEPSAPSLAAEFQKANPAVRMFFASGFSRETLKHMGYPLPPNAFFVQKPFQADHLLPLLR